MMSQIIDRRLNSRKKSTVNRQRFIQRYKKQLKKGVDEAISKRSITDIEKGEDINIPKTDINEPQFSIGQGGEVERVLPGNKEFIRGDQIPKPSGGAGQGQGDKASNQGEGEDDFVFSLTRDEFLDLYFDDLALPNLIRKELATINENKFIRAGYTTAGVPTNINVVRSMKQAIARRMALAAPYKKQLKELETQLKEAQEKSDASAIEDCEEKIKHLRHKVNRVPFIDTLDLRYNNKIKVPYPSTQAVMFCLMDVSGSMDETKKEIAKRFFILLYLFLKRNYERIELVFIRHHTSAKEVDEQEFFYSRETGGTVVSSALELTYDVIKQRYPTSAWNIYIAQASDGDNWNADSPYCRELLKEKIMPLTQYYTYVEIMPRHHQSLWEVYTNIEEKFENFAMQNIDNVGDIYPVFRELFKKEMA